MQDTNERANGAELDAKEYQRIARETTNAILDGYVARAAERSRYAEDRAKLLQAAALLYKAVSQAIDFSADGTPVIETGIPAIVSATEAFELSFLLCAKAENGGNGHFFISKETPNNG